MIKYKSEVKTGDDDIDLSGFFKEIREKRWWFIGAMAASLIAAFIYIRLTLPVYEASSTVLIQETNKPTVNMQDFLAGDLFGDQANIATEKGVLGSRSVMRDAIKELNLEVSYFNASVFPVQPLIQETTICSC
jgi:tyrosine-protein kinase Etk/Wzc